ncbi:SGNH/GDSL hydrolase family protein [Herbiconiux sp. CPCC 205716]|uniref:SGNH/GDSL hydrolase family protein n=1 Tax=Herbiconiux gentiana TaxID=2970912 RepID=A0ABT2GEN8_9MICO|nr:SGNH/GDSL hydrolase family protein [Herbiconiux gentiana]MCS5714685.1 SGNH/GDSL hydrolase family protein [Herbiconiux gentiana]
MNSGSEPFPSPMRFVALGDSFSEGVGDDSGRSFAGWTGRLATGLAETLTSEMQYANLAIRGRLFEDVVEEQLPAALGLNPVPTLITFCAGGNNLLRPRFRPEIMIAKLEAAADLIAASGAELVLVSPADPSARLPMGRLIHHRGDIWATALAEFARRRALLFVDVSHDSRLRHERFWAPDRLHMNANGHQWVADLVLHALMNRPRPAADRVVQPTARSVSTELAYFRSFVAPWMMRRLTGRSSGDGRLPSHPVWVRVSPGSRDDLPSSGSYSERDERSL